ncbi:MAG TPA: DeoR/GlpR family DNA-binding transcription regulator [Chitinophaga sp.]|uniref:DeoR/GlpR family DNA-binding transcription regulator n=1 Tax=Chitinophaga sp. TaxID=1869181 RepID=UPI002B62F6E1|nr:DeoR/GlpR family DNA-binding transcription regulator [Chitinophaga sp.]HVI48818.1 DeoR/GlpR family DNA-binding transcription regulator [Chitinophaga sp.]
MNYQIRKQKILERLGKTEEVTIRELAEMLHISEITVRRDLTRLSNDGQLYRTHGGAMKINQLEMPHNFVNKAAVNPAVKDSICRRAATEIRDGDIIFMDCGSTVFRLCQFIRNKKIKVITNSIPVIYELQNSQVSLNIIGGEFDGERQAMHGDIAAEHIARYHATKAFVGADGLSAKGLFANSEKEAVITKAIAAQSLHTYLLCDASKIGKTSYLRFAGFNIINTIITNGDPLELRFLKKEEVKVIRI